MNIFLVALLFALLVIGGLSLCWIVARQEDDPFRRLGEERRGEGR